MITKKIVLFSPATLYSGVPLALLAISKILFTEGYDIKIICKHLYNNYLEEILKSSENAICLGITCLTGQQISEALKVAEMVRSKYPALPIIWGGWHPSILPDQTILNPNVDIIVRGQGERTFTEVVHAIEDNIPLDGILGITYKKDGKIYSNPDRPFEDVNNFPPLPYSLINVEKCIEVTDLGIRTIRYVSSQGCPFRCGFCAETAVYKRRWSGLEAERVIEDIEILVNRYKIDSIIFTDDNFFVDKNRIIKICKTLIDKNIRIKWGHANGRTKQLRKFNDEQWELIKNSGCSSILIGAESGSQQILDLIKKDTEVEDTIKLVEICNRYNIKLVISTMIGLPYIQSNSSHKNDELKKSIKIEFNLIVNLFNNILSLSKKNQLLVFIYTPYPGNLLYDMSVSIGFKEPKKLEDWSSFDLNKQNLPWIPSKYINLVNMLSYMSLFTGVDSQYFIKDISNKHIKFGSIVTFKIFYYICSFRWKHKFFSLPIDYWIYSRLHSLFVLMNNRVGFSRRLQ